jgi:hypothetical protein
MGSSKSQPVTN